MILAVFLLGCGSSGPAFVVSEAFDGPTRHVTINDGEISMPFVVALEPVGSTGKSPRLEYGFDLAWTVTAVDEPATVRFVTFTDGDTWVPTPWEVVVADEETFAQASVAHVCGRGDDVCEARYDVRIEVREGGAVDLDWTVAAWAEGRGGSQDKVDADATSLTVEFGS